MSCFYRVFAKRDESLWVISSFVDFLLSLCDIFISLFFLPLLCPSKINSGYLCFYFYEIPLIHYCLAVKFFFWFIQEMSSSVLEMTTVFKTVCICMRVLLVIHVYNSICFFMYIDFKMKNSSSIVLLEWFALVLIFISMIVKKKFKKRAVITFFVFKGIKCMYFDCLCLHVGIYM